MTDIASNKKKLLWQMWHFIRDNSGLRTGVNAYKGSGRMTVVVSAICFSISQLNDAT